MATKHAPESFQVWMREASGEYYVVDPDGGLAVGPYREYEILRAWRVCESPTEFVLGRPHFYEVFAPIPVAELGPQWTRIEQSWLSPSITFYDDAEPVVVGDWFSLSPSTRVKLAELVSVVFSGVRPDELVAAVADVSVLQTHARGSTLVMLCTDPAISFAVIDWPDTPPEWLACT
jgi:hypothetical protein